MELQCHVTALLGGGRHQETAGVGEESLRFFSSAVYLVPGYCTGPAFYLPTSKCVAFLFCFFHGISAFPVLEVTGSQPAAGALKPETGSTTNPCFLRHFVTAPGSD